MGSKKSSTTTESKQTDWVPQWLEQGSQEAVGMARGISQREYTPYDQQRVANLADDEQAAIDLGREQGSSYQPLLNKAEDAADKSGTSWLDADREAYMNPFMEGALEPAARKIREQTARDVRDTGSQAAMAGAFGGSRATLLEGDARERGNTILADTYKEGFARAYDDAYQKFEGDRQNFARMAGEYRALGAQTQDQVIQEMNSLLTTGGLSRQLEQAGINFDYQQFIEARDWDITNLDPLLKTLQAVPYTRKSEGTNTQTTESKGSTLGAVVGVAAMVAGAITVNPALISGGASIASSSQGQ